MYRPRNGSPGSGSEPATRSTADITRRSMKPNEIAACCASVSATDLVRHGIRLVLHGIARIRDGQRPTGGRAALLDDVRELVCDELVAVRGVRLVLVLGEVDVRPGGEGLRRDGVIEVVRRRIGMDADIREVAQRGRELVRAPAVERRAAAAGGVDLVLHAGVDLARGHDPRALGARDGTAEGAVADVGDEI